MGELLKMPVLFAHFTEHQAQNKDISFYTFIYQHYQDDDGDDGDDERDAQLPFKSIETFSSYTNHVGLSTNQIKIKFIPFTDKADLQFANYNQLEIPSPYLSNIWQPPKYS